MPHCCHNYSNGNGCCRNCYCICSDLVCFNYLLLIVRTVRNPRGTLFPILPWILFSMTSIPHLFQKMNPNFSICQMNKLLWMIQFLNLLNLIQPYWVLLGYQDTCALCGVITHLTLICIKFTMRLCTRGEIFFFYQQAELDKYLFLSSLIHLMLTIQVPVSKKLR